MKKNFRDKSTKRVDHLTGAEMVKTLANFHFGVSKLIFIFILFQHWELIVLSRLKWDISSITPLDFLELLLRRLPITHRNCTDINLDKIRKHAQAFISLAARGEQIFNFFSSVDCNNINENNLLNKTKKKKRMEVNPSKNTALT